MAYRKHITVGVLCCTLLISLLFAGCNPRVPHHFDQETEENIKLDSTVLGVSVVADSLIVPWELVWGPDDRIWVVEERGHIMRINPSTGEKRIILKLPIGARPEGAQALLVHPDQKRYPYVYVHYKKIKEDGKRYHILERYEYRRDTLLRPKVIMEQLAGKSHSGSRLAFHTPRRILWATGDQAIKGATQDPNSFHGKVLRMDLDGNIPDDNPTPGSYVYALGFRNMQGLVVTPKGQIYTSEHGDASDDEINRIVGNGNYGFPAIEGTVDNDIEREFALEHNTIAPLIAWTPTIAPAGLDYYSSMKIPEWNNALLLVMLKGQGLRVLNLNEEGDRIEKEEVFLEKMYGRIRAICVSPDGDVYISTSNHDWNPMTSPDRRDDRILRIAKVKEAVKAPIYGKNAADISAQPKTGEVLYQQYCMSCHKNKGKGLKGIYPALASSEVVKDSEELIRTLVNGKKSGDYAMPSFTFLADEDMVRVVNYVRTNFGNDYKEIDRTAVQEIREKVQKK
ncbi:c-type cytochrome [Parapedobacter sp. SGR-10]|uniref:PQQ-dependent sugar dehydrogenase n=1 Tax=Parapedobacter sp. SGR-10 TaxID=2710879 RepID=UPI0013D1E4FA|nr:PQQ-dependent sugar dehydrogenase [Parapedobacter sp. SGR-10]NGF56393.1 c-type cytochrome [Parapedobacter sp. SGR-10]